MFEELEEEERGKREERKRLLRLTAYLVGAVLVVGAIIYIASRSHSKTSQAVKSLAAARQTVPDPVNDLKIVHAIMGKDPSGLRVMWSVQLRNKSAVYTYSDIQYEARFIGPDGSMRGANRDTIKTSIAPGEEERIPPFIDGIYDANASTYQFVLLGATSSAQ